MKHNIKVGNVVTLLPMKTKYMSGDVCYYCSHCFQINCSSIGTVLLFPIEYKFVQNTEKDLSLFMSCKSPYNGHHKLTSVTFIDRVIAT